MKDYNLASCLIDDLRLLRDKYSGLLMENSQFIGCLELFKFEVMLDLNDDLDEEE